MDIAQVLPLKEMAIIMIMDPVTKLLQSVYCILVSCEGMDVDGKSNKSRKWKFMILGVLTTAIALPLTLKDSCGTGRQVCDCWILMFHV